jgi:small basic protein (TIGR04137 family)
MPLRTRRGADEKTSCVLGAAPFPAATFFFIELQTENTMSQHNSFKASAAAGSSKRTVLKRLERIDLLKKRGQWDGKKIVGLPKTKPDV